MSIREGKGIVSSRTVLLIAIVQGFLFINATVWWGADWPANGVTVYLFLEAIFFGLLGYGVVVQKRDISWANVSISQVFLMWMFGFVLTWIVIYCLFEFGLKQEWGTIRSAEVMPIFMFQMFFVTPVEELIFRGMLPAEVKDHERWKNFPVLLIGTQVLFAMFHWAAYGGLGIPMVYAFAMGMIWVVASRKFSIYFTMGSHLAYNACILGILSGGII